MTMSFSASKLVLRGWSPTKGNEEEVYVSNQSVSVNSTSAADYPKPPIHTGYTSETSPDKATGTQLAQPTSSSPVLIAHHFPMAPSSDRRAQRNRSRDPTWIPRPRNAFIIFRCNYTRKHAARNSQELDEQSLTKTLSRRAGEAWKKLPTPEKDKFRRLADREREEHARLYPHYRFRPMRRQSLVGKQADCEHMRNDGNTFEGTIGTHSSSLTACTRPQDENVATVSLNPTSERSNKTFECAGRSRPPSVSNRDLLSTPPVVPSMQRDCRSYSLIDGIVIAREPSDCVAQVLQPPPRAAMDLRQPGTATGPFPSELPPESNCTDQQNKFDGVWQLGQTECGYSFSYPPSGLPLDIAVPFEDNEDSARMTAPLNVTSSLDGWDGHFGSLSPSGSLMGSVGGSGYSASSPSQVSSSSPPPMTGSVARDVSSEDETIHSYGLRELPCYPIEHAVSELGSGSSLGHFMYSSWDRDTASYDEMERAQALEAYAIGLQNCDLSIPCSVEL
ncbi:hypothetical protein EDC04DRAFT_1246710 [Pisolithus marmoratus]|nr:hypothetical protein EDC04DRAFT_1246710 [Pisolithus marmoratus]